MKVIFVAEIEATTNDIEDMKNVKMTKRIEAEKPSELLTALAFTNGTGNGVPTLENLLFHLFERRAAYCGRNYTIYIKAV